MTIQQVERHVIRPGHLRYRMLRDYCHLAKNLYNQANYMMREQYFRDRTVLGYCDLDKLCKANIDYPDYKNMPTAQSAQQVLRLLCQNWKSFYHARKDWQKHPEKYRAMPRVPGYLAKNGYQILILTNQNCKLKDGYILFPKAFHGFQIHTKCERKPGFKSFQQVRVISGLGYLTVEVVYKIDILDAKPDNGRYVGIDIGVDNLAVMANNFEADAIGINGRPLKSINHYYNKKLAELKSDLMMKHKSYQSNRTRRLTRKRHDKIRDYMHKASRILVDWCVEHDVSKIIIGQNKNWKQNVHMSKRCNQNFVSIPFSDFINMMTYKANMYGISVVLTEESYTSGTSFIDDEDPVKANYDKARRKHRGLFQSNNGLCINADLNGAYQIMKKVTPVKWTIGCVLHPVFIRVS